MFNAICDFVISRVYSMLLDLNIGLTIGIFGLGVLVGFLIGR
jgi:hypothetical protein